MSDKIIFIRESALTSIIDDAFTIGMLLAASAVNYYVFQQDTFWSIVLLCMWLIMVLGSPKKKHSTFTSYEDAIKYLESIKHDTSK